KQSVRLQQEHKYIYSVCVCVCPCVCVCVCVCPPVSLSVSPNLQQFFSGSSSVSLSCDDDGQTADGWTVKRTRGGLTEDCGAAAGFGRVHGSSCVLDRSVSSDGSYFCENSSGQQSDEVSIIVSDKGAILEIPALPVRTGNDLTMRCRERSGDTAAAYFSFNGRPVGSGTAAELVIRRVKQSDEGLYSCATDAFGSSPQSFLRVRGQNSDITSCLQT
uniref:Ig-like domain-containing protein n=1 Tax=Oreochromis niloticus TaxID=8128 RepID=A0A669EJI2_ORENI